MIHKMAQQILEYILVFSGVQVSKNRIGCLVLICPSLLEFSQKPRKEGKLDYLMSVDILYCMFGSVIYKMYCRL